MRDGVLVYFGYPQAHEDDAERAVRAGLELVAAVMVLKTHAPLHTRVGIATGLVVVGDLIGSGASQEQAIVGETPNLAARLQSIAEPNEVVIADTRLTLPPLAELTRKLDPVQAEPCGFCELPVGLGSMNGRGIGVLEHHQLAAVYSFSLAGTDSILAIICSAILVISSWS
jgi:class 3 adenylate cyclase